MATSVMDPLVAPAELPDPRLTEERMRRARDARLQVVLADHAPVWLIEEAVDPISQTVVSDLLFLDRRGWVRRRYLYDAEVDVLHFRGDEIVSSEEAARLRARGRLLVDED